MIEQKVNWKEYDFKSGAQYLERTFLLVNLALGGRWFSEEFDGGPKLDSPRAELIRDATCQTLVGGGLEEMKDFIGRLPDNSGLRQYISERLEKTELFVRDYGRKIGEKKW